MQPQRTIVTIKRDSRNAWAYPEPIMLLGLFFIVIFLATICVLVVFLRTQQKKPAPTPLPEQVIIQQAPTLPPPPIVYFNTYFPLVAGGEEPIQQQIWKVVRVEEQAYEKDGRRNDVATFTQVDTLQTLRGYCIDPGQPVPDVGAEYMLTGDAIFIPLQQPGVETLQRFSVIP